MDAAGVSFGEALNNLRSRQSVSFLDAQNGLNNLLAINDIFRAYLELFPDGSKVPSLPRKIIDARGLEADEILEKMGAALQALFPIDELSILEDGIEFIPIAPQTPSMSWDEFSKILEDPSQLGDESEFITFCMLIWSIGNSVDKETWDTLNDGLGWNVRWPKKIIKTDDLFDADLLSDNLEKAGLGMFMAPISCAWRDTDNFWFDFDINEESYPEFSFENIVKLAEDWHAGQEISRDINLAMAVWQAGRGTLQKVVDVMGKSIKQMQEPKTLMEVFSGEGSDDELFESEDA